MDTSEWGIDAFSEDMAECIFSPLDGASASAQG